MNEKRKGKVLIIGAEDEENLAIRYLGAELKRNENQVKIAGCSNYHMFKSVLDELESFKPDVVAVSMAFQSMAIMFLDLIGEIKKNNPEVHLTVGGHFPTFEYEKILGYDAVDSVIRFEGEKAISKLTSAIINEKNLRDVLNLVHKSSDGSIKENYVINEFPDLDELPFPLREAKPQIRLGERFSTLVSSRGCFHSRCIYCCIGAFHKQKTEHPYALRTPENVALEIAELYHNKNVRLFQFHDDNFLLPSTKRSYNRLNSLKKSLVKEKVDLEEIAFLIKTRPDGINEEILILLEELGTVGVFLGVENASNSGLKALARGSNMDDVYHSLKLLENYHMGVTFNLLMFHPRATLKEINENIYFMNQNLRMAFDFGRAEIVAGSPLERLVKRKGLLRGDWPHWDYRIQDDATEKMFRINALTFYQENSPYPELSHKLIALSYRSELNQRFYPGTKSHKLKKETMNLIQNCNKITLKCLVDIYRMVPETGIEEKIDRLAHEMKNFYGDRSKKADKLAEKMWRFQFVGKKFQKHGVEDYFQDSPTLGKIFRI
ncbi:MAG TPA: radical SAM protein [Methanothermobacter sp.]|nr:radical SAM protein [Methanothermobacter sp.]